MTKYIDATPEEQRQFNLRFGRVSSIAATTAPEVIKANFTQAQAQDYKQGIIKHNMGKTLGISADMVPDDTETTDHIQNVFDQSEGVMPTFKQLATQYPAFAKTASSSVNNMVLAKEHAESMGFWESAVTGASSYSRYNELEDQITAYSLKMLDPKTNRNVKRGLYNLINDLTYEQSHYQPDNFGFVMGQASRGLYDFLKYGTKGAFEGVKSIPKFALGVGVATGAGLAAFAPGPAKSLAIPGFALGAGAGAAAAVPYKITTELFRHYADLGRAQINRAQVNAGIPQDKLSDTISNVGGIVLGMIDVVGAELAVGVAGKAVSPILTRSGIQSLKNVAKASPLAESIVSEIVKNEARYLNKPVSEAVWHATKGVFAQSGVVAAEVIGQNLTTNISMNMALANAGEFDKMQSIPDLIKGSFQGVPEQVLAFGPISVLTSIAGGAGVYRKIKADPQYAESRKHSYSQLNKAIDDNELHTKTPEVMTEFYKNLSEKTGAKGVDIHIKDANEQIIKLGLDPEQVYEQAGIGDLYQHSFNNGEDFVHIPFDRYSDMRQNPITPEGQKLTDVLEGSYKFDNESFTPNQETEISKIMSESDTEQSESYSDMQIQVDEIKDIMSQRIKTAMAKTGKSTKEINLIADRTSKIFAANVMRISDKTGMGIEYLKAKMMPEFIGPAMFEQTKSAIRSRIKAEVLDTESGVVGTDIGYRIRQKLKGGKKIYIESRLISDFKEVIAKFPKGTFTTTKADGLPWESFFSELIGTSDQNDIISSMENSKFHNEKQINDLINKAVNEEIRFNEYLKKQEEAEGPRPIGWVDPFSMKRVINITSNTNESTIMHELAHIFLTTKHELFQQGKGNDEFNADWSILKDWLGFEDGKAIDKKQHETFAYGFEAYLKDGKAPSKELIPVFRKFREWITNIYAGLKAAVLSREIINKTAVPDKEVAALRKAGWIIDQEIGINISPEMRGVFDRMLASQDEIDLVRIDAGATDSWFKQMRSAGIPNVVINMLKKYADLGMEKAFRRLMNAQMGELEKTFVNARKKFEKQQYDETVKGTVAHDILNGKNIYNVTEKFRQAIKAKDLDKAFEKLQKLARDVIAGKKPASELAGAEIISGNKTILETANDIINGQKPSEYIKDRVDLAVQEKYPHMMESATFYDRAMEAYHNVNSLISLLGQSEALKAAGENMSGESVLRDVVLPEVKAEAIDKLRTELTKFKEQLASQKEKFEAEKKQAVKEAVDYEKQLKHYQGQFDRLDKKAVLTKEKQKAKAKLETTIKELKEKHADAMKRQKDFMAWEREQVIDKIKKSQLIKDWKAQWKESDAKAEAKAKELYDRLFREAEYKESMKSLKDRAMLIKESQRRIVAEMSVSEIRKAVRTLVTSERTAAVMSAKYLAKGDVTKAMEQKFNQAKYHARLSEAIKANRRNERNIKYLDKTKKLSYTKFKSQMFFDAAFDILSRFGMTLKDKDRYQKGTFLSWANDTLNSAQVPDWLLDTALSKDIDSLNPGELQDLSDIIRAIRHQANVVDSIKFRDQRIMIDELNDLFIKFAKSNDKSFKYQEGQAGIKAKKIGKELKHAWKNTILEMQQKIKRFGVFVELVDNPIFKYVLLPFRDAAGFFETESLKDSIKYIKMNERVKLSELLNQTTEFEFRKGEYLTVYDIYGIYHHLGNDSNRQRLIDGYRDKFGDHWTNEYVKSMEKYITDDMMDTIQEYWDHNESRYPEAAATEERITGFAPIKIEAKPLTVNGKEYAGGWAPLTLADEFVNKAVHYTQDANQKFGDYSAYHTIPSANSMKARSEGKVLYVVNIDPIKMQKGSLQILRDTYYREPLINASKLLRSEKFHNLWRSKYGVKGERDLIAWQEYINTNGQSENANVGDFDKIMDSMTQATTTAALAHSLGNAMADMSSFFFMAPRYLGVKGTVDALFTMPAVASDIAVRTAKDVLDVITGSQLESLGDPHKFNDQVAKARQSALMRSRFEDNYNMTYRASYEAMPLTGKRKRWLNTNLMFGVFHWVQMMMEIPVWNVTYDRGIAVYGNHQKAMDLADSAVVDVFGSRRLEDRAKSLRKTTGIQKVFNQFQSWMYHQGGNLLIEADRVNQGTPLQKTEALSYILAFMVLQPVVSAWASGRRPKDEENIWQWSIKEDLNTAFRMLIPVAGPTISRPLAEILTFTYNPRQSKVESPFFQAVLEAGEASYDTVKYFQDEKEGQATLESWSRVMAKMPNVPYVNQMHTLLWNFVDMMNGEIDFEIRDLERRRPASERE